MAVQNITQLRRVVFRKWDAAENEWSVFTLEADDLGQDTVMTLNVAPRMRARASSLGSTSTAVSGTLDNFSGSITFLMDTFKNLGKAIQKWNEATYAGASATAGNIIWDGTDICADGNYMSVIAQKKSFVQSCGERKSPLRIPQRGPYLSASKTVSRVLYLTIIYLDVLLPARSSHPGSGRANLECSHTGVAPDRVYSITMFPCDG